MATLLAFGVAGALALFALPAADDRQDDPARDHAEAACDLTAKADEAAQVETDARLAAAVLLLDRAIIESARAAESDRAFADLDQAVQAVHTAGHQGTPGPWQDAIETALATCDAAVGPD